MKTDSWFGRLNPVLSRLRIATAGSLVVVGIAIASIALKTASPPMATKSHHTMSPFVVLGPKASSATSPAQISQFPCQVGQDTFTCYDLYQIRHAYQIDSLINAGYDGTGHTIVIVDAFQNPNLVSEVESYDVDYGLPTINLTQIAPDGLTAFDENNCDQVGWAVEISLDVEWAHAIAPGANIVLVLAKSDNDADFVSALKYVVDNDLGDVLSMSFGENESCVDPDILSKFHDIFAEATQKNITLFASSGDEGASQLTCDGNSWVKAVSFPASDPLVTGVGATELHAADYCLTELGCDPSANPVPGTYEGEIAWNQGPPPPLPSGCTLVTGTPATGTLATGGGFSVLFDEPPYQEGTTGLHGGKQRPAPDVAYNGAVMNHGILTWLDFPGIEPSYYSIGGTSAGSIQWAAITAIANQKAGARLGFLNKAIYHIGKKKKDYPASFHDITSGTNSVVEFDSSNNPVTIIGFNAATGWDPTTGTGSPIAPGLVDYLINNVSPGDGQSAIATTKPKPHSKPIVPGHMHSH